MNSLQKYFSLRRKTSLVLALLFVSTCFLITVTSFGPTVYRQFTVDQAVNDYIQNHKFITIVLDRHPTVLPRVTDHFRTPYLENGMAGMETAKYELLQIWIVNYITDFIWIYTDEALQDYLNKQYLFLSALKENSKSTALCEQYLSNSGLYKEAQIVAGGTKFKDYMDATEKLFLSTQKGIVHELSPDIMIPNHREYIIRKTQYLFSAAVKDYAHKTKQDFESYIKFGDKTCTGRLLSDYVALQMPLTFQSTLWRATMEDWRPISESMRHNRGSD